jgi:hypothetical protein
MARALCWRTLLVAIVMVSTATHAAEINWQEAIANLAYERSQAEMCVRLLKKFGDKATIERSSVKYDEAKAEYDGIIGGLIAALAQRDEPGSLNDLQDRTQRGFEKREAFCKSVQPLVPSSTGQKGVIDQIVAGALGPVIDAVKVIWVKRMDENALTRATIQTQLEATKWLPFGSVAP